MAAKFKNKKDIVEAVLAIAKMLEKWGLKSDEWMIGKQMGFYFNQAISRPSALGRDTNVYVLYKRLPWQYQPKGRLIFPPKKSIYAKQYLATQKRYNLGIDLMPLPDRHLKAGFITQNRFMKSISGKEINFESIEKFIERAEVITRYFLDKSDKEVRNFYFADKKRYKERLMLYAKIRKAIQDRALLQRMDGIIDGYTSMMRRVYPAIFGKMKSLDGGKDMILHGQSAFFQSAIMKGTAVLYNSKVIIRPRKGKHFFIFSHFYPSDTVVLPFAKAIITEGGGLLCHAAIVCREYKVPCLVGVRGLMASIKNGQKLSVDFQKGRVKILE